MNDTLRLVLEREPFEPRLFSISFTRNVRYPSARNRPSDQATDSIQPRATGFVAAALQADKS